MIAQDSRYVRTKRSLIDQFEKATILIVFLWDNVIKVLNNALKRNFQK